MAQRFLIFGPSWLGDAVMAIPTYKALRRGFPAASLHVVARDPVLDLYRGVPEVDGVIRYRRRAGAARLAGYVDLVRRLEALRADTALVLPRSFGSAWTALLAGVPRRIGYGSAGRDFLLTDPVPREERLLQTHRVHYFQHLLTPLGLAPPPEAPEIAVDDAAEARAEELLAPLLAYERSHLVAVNPGAAYGSAKQWPEDRYVALIDELVAGCDAAVALVGGPGDRDVCDRIQHAADPGPILDLSGQTNVLELAAVLRAAGVVVSNDTGAMHVADAVGAPVVAIFGPTDPVTTAPYRARQAVIREPVDCSPCLLRACPIDHRCMTRVDVERVLEACLARLGNGATRPAHVG